MIAREVVPTDAPKDIPGESPAGASATHLGDRKITRCDRCDTL